MCGCEVVWWLSGSVGEGEGGPKESALFQPAAALPLPSLGRSPTISIPVLRRRKPAEEYRAQIREKQFAKDVTILHLRWPARENGASMMIEPAGRLESIAEGRRRVRSSLDEKGGRGVYIRCDLGIRKDRRRIARNQLGR